MDNVRDDLLNKELKKLLRTHPDVSFLDVGEEAIGWAKEDEKLHESRPRMASARETTPSSQPPSLATTMNKIMKTPDHKSQPSPNVSSISTSTLEGATC